MPEQVPPLVIEVVGEVLGAYYFSHRRIADAFAKAGAPGEAPQGNCSDKSVAWLRRCNSDNNVDARLVLGRLLQRMMEGDWTENFRTQQELDRQRARVATVLQKHGLQYLTGGRVESATGGTASLDLGELIRTGNFDGIQLEFDRALKSVRTDPGAAITAASAILEAVFHTIIHEERLTAPGDLSIKPLWKAVSQHFQLDPTSYPSEDLRKIVSGLSSIVDGIGAFRTHAGSAHGRAAQTYRPAPRHARLAVNAAHSLALFVLETWRSKKPG
jgi:hypothetical protein